VADRVVLKPLGEGEIARDEITMAVLRASNKTMYKELREANARCERWANDCETLGDAHKIVAIALEKAEAKIEELEEYKFKYEELCK